ncbi:protein CBFA2T1 isoform X4 [Leucoraja erinacea]|uniref:protein CBFA2T1 isoform X4 n=1 Tax=Leucoraja erinaceus TaxID=7782 RepID=UPI0024572699|nr:protein CBFA2T1 isoform X4 [Leucoraja erinacea]
MPDSPAEVKTQSQLTPPAMPPPPPTIIQGPARNISFSPTTKGLAGLMVDHPQCPMWIRTKELGIAPVQHSRTSSVVQSTILTFPLLSNTKHKSKKPVAVMNGTNHLPTAISGAPSIPKGLSDGPATSTTASLTNQQLPPTCGARQLSKLKRFLTTLQQFANDISPEIGERVRNLVLGLVNSTRTIEEFHSKLQEATNFPLRPFVIPFLKANLPLLQRELFHCARLAKQTPAQYLAQHEQLLLNGNSSLPIDSSEILLGVNENGKRSTPDRTKENGLDHDPSHTEHVSKRLCALSPGQCFSPSHRLGHQSNGPQHLAPPQLQHYRLEDMAGAHHYRDSYRQPEHKELRDRNRPAGIHGTQQEEVIDHRLTDREWAEEWKHLDNLLNCIMDMVEKTRRSLTVLRRCQEADREELNHWIRRYSDAEDMKKEIRGEMPRRPTQGYTREEIWKKAEEAVNEVKRHAMTELKKAVSEAERKAHEMITAERAKMERALREAKRQASDDAQSAINQQEDSSEAFPIHTASWSREGKADEPADISTITRATPCPLERSRTHCGLRQMVLAAPPSESCWNCGRKASETCSGCNTARYCGSFCQHKDWEKHHHVCGLNGQGPQSMSTASSPPSDSGSHLQSDVVPSSGAECTGDTGSVVSRCASPATPNPVETASH